MTQHKIFACLIFTAVLFFVASPSLVSAQTKKPTSDPFRKDKTPPKVEKEAPNHFKEVLEKEIVIQKPKSRFADRPKKTKPSETSWDDDDGGDWGEGGDWGSTTSSPKTGSTSVESASGDEWSWGSSDDGESWDDDVFPSSGMKQTQPSGSISFQGGFNDPGQQETFSQAVAKGIASIFKKK